MSEEVDIVTQTLIFSDSKTDGRTDIEITLGPFAGVKYNYGRTWFPENADGDLEPVLSFEYDVVSENKPGELLMRDFQKQIGDILHTLLLKSLSDNSTVYSGGSDDGASKIVLERT